VVHRTIQQDTLGLRRLEPKQMKISGMKCNLSRTKENIQIPQVLELIDNDYQIALLLMHPIIYHGRCI
jgi:hypothetical protein